MLAALGLELVKGADKEIQSHINQVLESAKTIIPADKQTAFFTALQGKKTDLYAGAAKDLASSLVGHSNAGNDVAITVSGACHTAGVEAHYKYKMRAAAFSAFGNSKKAALEEKKAEQNPPKPPPDDFSSLTVGGVTLNPMMIAGAGVILFLLLRKK